MIAGHDGPASLGHRNSWWAEYSEASFGGVPPSRLWSLKLLNSVVESKDGYTGGHCQRVQGYARALGESLGLTNGQLRSLMISAAFHDIGKVGVVSTILNKPGPLDTFQWRVIYMHPVLGRELWEGAVPGLRDVAQIIHQHHERWDGQGYPQRLSGPDIRVEARVLSVVDAYDAMCIDRPYRLALAPAVVLDELRTGTGTQFGPDEAAAFIEIVEGRKLKAA